MGMAMTDQRMAAGARCVPLRFEEEAGFDAGRIEALYRDMGGAGAEAAISAAVRELTGRLARIETATPAQACGVARRMVGIAEGIGLTTLARAARQAADAAAAGEAARAATAARLVRIGERSLFSVWDLDES